MLLAYDIKEKPRVLKEICRPEKSGYLRCKYYNRFLRIDGQTFSEYFTEVNTHQMGYRRAKGK